MRRILSRHQGTPTQAIGIWVLWCNAEGGLKDKQMSDFILIMGLKSCDRHYNLMIEYKLQKDKAWGERSSARKNSSNETTFMKQEEKDR